MQTNFSQYEPLIKQVPRLHLSALSIAEGMHTGNFRSSFRGQGVEFTGVRDYLRGDDIRTIDWNVTARLGKPFVKVFEEDRELIVFLVVDQSLSMETGFAKRTRLQTAHEAAALLAFASEYNASPLGAVFFDGEIGFSSVPRLGRNQVLLLLNKLESVTSERATGSVLGSALKGAFKLLKNRSLVIILSDFRTSGYEQQLARLGAKHDVVAVRITDPSDSELPSAGDLSFVDRETGAVRRLPTSNSRFKREWKQLSRERVDRFQTTCIKRGVSPLVLSTEDDVVAVFERFFSSRERRI